MSTLSDDEIRRLCDEATPGPWEPRPGIQLRGKTMSWAVHADGRSPAGADTPENAAFIAAARTLVPMLLERARRAEDALAKAEALLAVEAATSNARPLDTNLPWPVPSIWVDQEGQRYTLRGMNEDGLVVLAPHRDLRLRHCWNTVAFERDFTRVEVP